MNVLVVDIGGTGVKLAASGRAERQRFKSGPSMSPERLVRTVRELTGDWDYDAVAVGFPGLVIDNRPAAEPGNLSGGWTGFDFASALGRPARVVNDAVLQALGAYDGGRMLFLGLGTGVGSALVSEHVIMPLELGCLTHTSGAPLVEHLGRAALKRGYEPWRQALAEIVPVLHQAFLTDYIVLGGGNARHVNPLPPRTRRGSNRDAIRGGFRLWDEMIEPHDTRTVPTWRIVR